MQLRPNPLLNQIASYYTYVHTYLLSLTCPLIKSSQEGIHLENTMKLPSIGLLTSLTPPPSLHPQLIHPYLPLPPLKHNLSHTRPKSLYHLPTMCSILPHPPLEERSCQTLLVTTIGVTFWWLVPYPPPFWHYLPNL